MIEFNIKLQPGSDQDQLALDDLLFRIKQANITDAKINVVLDKKHAKTAFSVSHNRVKQILRLVLDNTTIEKRSLSKNEIIDLFNTVHGDISPVTVRTYISSVAGAGYLSRTSGGYVISRNGRDFLEQENSVEEAVRA